MADLIRMGAAGGGVMVMQRDKLGSPSTGSEDGGGGGGGGIDLADLAPELDHDEFDGPATLNGESVFFIFYFFYLIFILYALYAYYYFYFYQIFVRCLCYQFYKLYLYTCTYVTTYYVVPL